LICIFFVVFDTCHIVEKGSSACLAFQIRKICKRLLIMDLNADKLSENGANGFQGAKPALITVDNEDSATEETKSNRKTIFATTMLWMNSKRKKYNSPGDSRIPTNTDKSRLSFDFYKAVADRAIVRGEIAKSAKVIKVRRLFYLKRFLPFAYMKKTGFYRRLKTSHNKASFLRRSTKCF